MKVIQKDDGRDLWYFLVFYLSFLLTNTFQPSTSGQYQNFHNSMTQLQPPPVTPFIRPCVIPIILLYPVELSSSWITAKVIHFYTDFITEGRELFLLSHIPAEYRDGFHPGLKEIHLENLLSKTISVGKWHQRGNHRRIQLSPSFSNVFKLVCSLHLGEKFLTLVSNLQEFGNQWFALLVK